jgi:sphingomyelin phosphodiesterase
MFCVQPDLIVWTGDLIAHNIWEYTREHHLAVMSNFTQMLLDYFPGVRVYSATGNHEGVPVNQFPDHTVPDRFSHDWLYSAFAANWSNWLPADSTPSIKWYTLKAEVWFTKACFRRASFMSSPYPGLRIISLNTIYGLDGNLYVSLLYPNLINTAG